MAPGTKKKSTTPRPIGPRPKPDDPIRFEGEAYVFSGPEEGAPPGYVAFHRPPKRGKGDTKYKRVLCEERDLRWSEAHQAFYLPGRGVDVTDIKHKSRPSMFVEDGLPADMAEQKVRAYLGG